MAVSPSAATSFPWTKATPVPPGTLLPLTLSVNGAPAAAACAGAQVSLRTAPGQQDLSFEPSNITLPSNASACGLLYTAYATPTLVAAVTAAPAGVEVPALSYPLDTNTSAWTANVYGSWLTPSPARDVTVTVGGWPCVPTATGPVSTVALDAASSAALSGNGGVNVTRMSCIVPKLPAGDWPLNVSVAGYGLARPPATPRAELPVLTYPLRVLRQQPLSGTANQQDCQVCCAVKHVRARKPV